MATQSEVLQAVDLTGSYSASLYKFSRTGICVRGIREVSPAEKLTEKGVLVLKEWSEETFDGGTVVRFTWVKA